MAEVKLTPDEAHELFSMFLASGIKPGEVAEDHPLITGAAKLAVLQAPDKP